MFNFGILAGIGMSPFAYRKPQDIITSPTQKISAQENAVHVQSIPMKKPQAQTFTAFFSKFDKEQEWLLTVARTEQTQVLGTSDLSMGENTEVISRVSKSVIIALFGDSMIDTMETGTPYLQRSLQPLYPNVKFTLLNYGIGAQTISKGRDRLNDNFVYKDRNYPAILASNADLFVIDSFAYNPLENIEEYESALRDVLTRFKSTGKPVYLLATIAPLKSNFGKGPDGVNWDNDTAWTHATKIQTHIEKAISVAQSLGLPVIDCYHPTLSSSGEGNATYVNTHDGIHPSVLGHQYIANSIAHQVKID